MNDKNEYIIVKRALQSIWEHVIIEDLEEEKHLPVDGDEYMLEMSMVAGGFNGIKLAVWGREGNYPHFHFYKKLDINSGIPNEGRGGGCICIKEPAYFIHGTHQDIMNKKEIQSLIEFLKKQYKNYSVTNWEYIIGLWNDNNPDCTQIPPGQKIPDYTSNMSSIMKKQ